MRVSSSRRPAEQGASQAPHSLGTFIGSSIHREILSKFKLQKVLEFGVVPPAPPPQNTNYLCSTNSIVQKESCNFPDIETTCFLHQCQVSEGREPPRHSRQMVSFQVSEKSQIWQLHKHINKNSCHSICAMNEDNIKAVTNEIIFDSLLWNPNSFYFIN